MPDTSMNFRIFFYGEDLTYPVGFRGQSTPPIFRSDPRPWCNDEPNCRVCAPQDIISLHQANRFVMANLSKEEAMMNGILPAVAER